MRQTFFLLLVCWSLWFWYVTPHHARAPAPAQGKEILDDTRPTAYLRNNTVTFEGKRKLATLKWPRTKEAIPITYVRNTRIPARWSEKLL